MKLAQPTLTTMLQQQMKYLSQRQATLAQNISNIDTPGYQAQDLQKPNFSQMAQSASSGQLAMATTTGKHMTGTRGNSGLFKTMMDKNTSETSPTKNNVSLEEQMAKVSDTGLQYQMSSTLLKKYYQLYRAALGNH